MTIEDKLIKRDLQQAQWIGEDGGMAVDGRFSKETAFRKMRRLINRACGKDENTDFSIDDIGIAFFHLTPEVDKPKYDDSEWYVSAKLVNKHDPWVWAYWG